MSVVILDIKNDEKGKYLLDFLKQVDFLEIKDGKQLEDYKQSEDEKGTLEEFLLNAPVFSEEEIQEIENIGREFESWKIKDF